MYFIEWPFNKNKNKPLRRNPDKKTNRLIYSNIGVSFRETVPLNNAFTKNEELMIYRIYTHQNYCTA